MEIFAAVINIFSIYTLTIHFYDVGNTSISSMYILLHLCKSILHPYLGNNDHYPFHHPYPNIHHHGNFCSSNKYILHLYTHHPFYDVGNTSISSMYILLRLCKSILHPYLGNNDLYSFHHPYPSIHHHGNFCSSNKYIHHLHTHHPFYDVGNTSISSTHILLRLCKSILHPYLGNNDLYSFHHPYPSIHHHGNFCSSNKYIHHLHTHHPFYDVGNTSISSTH